jgi:hypothetical protein
VSLARFHYSRAPLIINYRSMKVGGGQVPADLKPRVQECFERLNESMEPLLRPDFLLVVRNG